MAEGFKIVIHLFIFCSLLAGPAAEETFGQHDMGTMEELFRKAAENRVPGQPRFLIVPGADLQRAGAVSAAAWKSIPDDAEYENIILIRSAYGEPFTGVALSGKTRIETPFGGLELNREIADALLASGSPFIRGDTSSDPADNHSRLMSWISYRFGKSARVVPMEIGSSSVRTARDLAMALLPQFREGNLFVISADFSRYPTYEDAKKIDRMTFEAIESNDPAEFYTYLQSQSQSGIRNLSSPCSGWCQVLSMLYMSGREDIHILPLLYRNSGDVESGRKDRVVGYWSIAGYSSPGSTEQRNIQETEAESLLEYAKASIREHLKPGSSGEFPCPDTSLQAHGGLIIRISKHGIRRGSAMAFDKDTSLCSLLEKLALEAAFEDEGFYPLGAHELDQILLEIVLLSEIRSLEKPVDHIPPSMGLLIKNGQDTRYYLPGEIPGDLQGFLDRDEGNCFTFRAFVIRETGKL